MLSSRFPIELVPHDARWLARARDASARLREILGDVLVVVEHIGSTSIPTIRAKPIVDLLPIVTSLDGLDAHRAAIEAHGYEWRGEFGLANRRYCVLADGETRIVQAHFYPADDPSIARHLAFRDYLRAHPDEARAYETEKLRARSVQPDDVQAYNDEKNAWIKACERRALAWADDRARPDASAR